MDMAPTERDFYFWIPSTLQWTHHIWHTIKANNVCIHANVTTCVYICIQTHVQTYIKHIRLRCYMRLYVCVHLCWRNSIHAIPFPNWYRRGAEVDTDHVASLGLGDLLPSTKDGLHIPDQSWMTEDVWSFAIFVKADGMLCMLWLVIGCLCSRYSWDTMGL